MRSPPRRVEIGERKLLKTRDPLPCIFRLGFGYPIYDRRKMKPEDSPTFKVNHQAAVRSAQIPPPNPRLVKRMVNSCVNFSLRQRRAARWNWCRQTRGGGTPWSLFDRSSKFPSMLHLLESVSQRRFGVHRRKRSFISPQCCPDVEPHKRHNLLKMMI
jgi:hypothetical protein